QVPMVKAETEGRAGRTPDQPARTRECKLGATFTQTVVDDQGRPVRDEESTTYVGAIETAEEFGSTPLHRGLQPGLGPCHNPRGHGRWLALDLEYCRSAFSRRNSNSRSLSCPRASLGSGSEAVSG